NSPVLARRASSERAWTSGSNALTSGTSEASAFTFLPSPARRTRVNTDIAGSIPAGRASLIAMTAVLSRLRRDHAPVVILAAMVGTYVGVFGALTWHQQSNFGTFGFDMGIYDQAIWLLSRFKDPFVTVRGLEYFGHHVNPITVLFVPAYWLGAGPHFLYLAETAALALGAVPVWLLARDRLGSPWMAP